MKDYIPSFEEFINESYMNDMGVNEGAVKQFEMAMKSLISNIKQGYGWIDPEYVEDTITNDSSFDDFEWDTIKDEVYKRLINKNLLYKSMDTDEETKGSKITKLSQIQESTEDILDESKSDFVFANIIKGDGEELQRGKSIKVNALEYTQSGDDEEVTVVGKNGNTFKTLKRNLKVRI